MALQEAMDSKAILKDYIVDGMVNYQRLKEDQWFWDNLEKIREEDISNYSNFEKLAFWLNAYNLVTLAAVIDEFEKNPNWRGNQSKFSVIKFFGLKRHRIAGRKISLYTLENKIIRKQFGDPRIHFALNCASTSCPALPGKLFDGETLDDHLNRITFDFINNQNGIKIEGDNVRLSRIFKWYKKDFKGEGGVLEFIKKYWKGNQPIPDSPRISYLDYNWDVNQLKLELDGDLTSKINKLE